MTQRVCVRVRTHTHTHTHTHTAEEVERWVDFSPRKSWQWPKTTQLHVIEEHAFHFPCVFPLSSPLYISVCLLSCTTDLPPLSSNLIRLLAFPPTFWSLCPPCFLMQIVLGASQVAQCWKGHRLRNTSSLWKQEKAEKQTVPCCLQKECSQLLDYIVNKTMLTFCTF